MSSNIARWTAAFPPLAPSRIVVAGALATVLLGLWLVWIATRAPWFGVQIESSGGGPGVRVRAVDPDGPSAGRLAAGDVIVALASQDDVVTPIDPLTAARSAYAFDSFARVHRFLDAHRALIAAARAGTVWVLRDDGSRVEVQPLPTRPWQQLPAVFWMTSLLASVALLAACGVLAFRHRETVVRVFFLGTLGFVGTQATAAVIFGRELVFDADWAATAVSINLGARLLSYWSLVMMLWLHPRRFRPLRASVPVAAAFALAWLGEALEWWPRPNLATPLMATLTSLVAAPALGGWQWRATRGHALDRAVVKVCLLSFAVPTLLLTLTYQLPRLFGHPPLIESLAALSAINLLMFVGFGLGIARFRLFLLDRWWFETLLWAAGGAVVIALDLLLMWLNASAGLALGVSLALAGWAYFPARQWLWQRFDRSPTRQLERHLPHLVDELFQAESRAELTQRWQALVEEIFQPLATSHCTESALQPQLTRDGQALLVPALEPGNAVLLEHAAKGQRLFSPADVELASELLALTRRAADARQAMAQRRAERDARLREREAMVQDLHDGLGGLASNIALLAGMAQRDTATDPRRTFGTIEQLATESLSEIRGFMSSLDTQDADWDALIADLRADASRRLEPHGVQLEMTSTVERATPPPDPLLRLNLTRLCQEALNNVVKHAGATRVSLALDVSPQRLSLTIADDGRGLPDDAATTRSPPSGARSRGLGIMRRRAQQLGGTLRWERSDGTTVRLSVPLPLLSPSPGMPASPGAP